MGCFNATCAITRMTILSRMPVVCIRVDRKTEEYPYRHWDDTNHGKPPGLVGVWFGPYNDYGTIDEAPRTPESGEDRFRYADILILKSAWDEVVKFEREAVRVYFEKHPEDLKYKVEEPGDFPLLSGYHRREREIRRIFEGYPPENGSPEEGEARFFAALGRKDEDDFFSPVRAWPIWLYELGAVMNYAVGARINLLGAATTRGQHNEINRIDHLAKITKGARKDLKRRMGR